MNKSTMGVLAGLIAFASILYGSQDAYDRSPQEQVGHTQRGKAKQDGHAEDVKLSQDQRLAAGITVVPLRRRSVTEEIRAPGEVHLNSYATISVAPRIAAQIVQRHARLGDAVTVGQRLVTLSSVEMAQAQGELLVAEREWQRVKKLGRGVVSAQRYTEARVRRDQTRGRVTAYGMTEQELQELISTGKSALADGRFQLLAAQAGTVIYDEFVVGELVDGGRVLFRVSDESVLWVEARLTPDQAIRVRVGGNAVVHYGKQRVVGRVVQVHHLLDETTRTLGVRIEIENSGDRLHPGVFVDARIEGADTVQAFVVPNEAVLRSPDGDWIVFVEKEANNFSPREIKVLRTTATSSIIEGLAPGTRVVTRGAFFLQSELAKSGFDVHNH